jgi:GNAT superfamily N-acetyltransferase
MALSSHHFLDYYLKGVLMYAKPIEFFNFKYYEDVLQRTKYMHNFLMIDNPPMDSKMFLEYINLTKPYGFTQFMSLPHAENEIFHTFFQDKEVIDETYQWMELNLLPSMIENITSSYPISPLDKTNLEPFLAFHYQGDVQYGEVYALENGIRTQAIVTHNKHVQYALAMDGDTIVGQVGWIQYEDVIEIDDFIVQESHRYQGIGKALYQHVLKYASALNIRKLILISDPDSEAYRMYQKWGFQLGPTYRCIRIIHESKS